MRSVKASQVEILQGQQHFRVSYVARLLQSAGSEWNQIPGQLERLHRTEQGEQFQSLPGVREVVPVWQH